MNKILDCFLFYDEIQMLKSRLEFLGPLVDEFVICESTVDFKGNPKKINLTQEILERLPHQDKINFYIFDPHPIFSKLLFPLAGSLRWRKLLWKIQHMQRDSLLKALINHNEDSIIVFGDLDEFPSEDSVMMMKTMAIDDQISAVKQEMYYYNYLTKHIQPWLGTAVCRLKIFRNTKPSTIRQKRLDHNPLFSGWHFSYFMDESQILNKIKIISAAENLSENDHADTNKIRAAILQGKDLFNRESVEIYKSNEFNIPHRLKEIFDKNFYFNKK
jgi:beta-1,4-mannosyl-glycoprotein beta-1,4-N-acetylglucosaminyltransferase